MPQVTGCLRDPEVQVRRTTLTLLINLLQEDYLKLKGSFFYRILQVGNTRYEDTYLQVSIFPTDTCLAMGQHILINTFFLQAIGNNLCHPE